MQISRNTLPDLRNCLKWNHSSMVQITWKISFLPPLLPTLHYQMLFRQFCFNFYDWKWIRKKFLNSKIWTLRSKEELCCICVERRRGDHLDVWWKESTSWKSLSQRKTRQWLDGSMLSDISGDEWTKVFTLKLFQAFCQLGNNFLKKKTNNAFETWKPSNWKQAWNEFQTKKARFISIK